MRLTAVDTFTPSLISESLFYDQLSYLNVQNSDQIHFVAFPVGESSSHPHNLNCNCSLQVNLHFQTLLWMRPVWCCSRCVNGRARRHNAISSTLRRPVTHEQIHTTSQQQNTKQLKTFRRFKILSECFWCHINLKPHRSVPQGWGFSLVYFQNGACSCWFLLHYLS